MDERKGKVKDLTVNTAQVIDKIKKEVTDNRTQTAHTWIYYSMIKIHIRTFVITILLLFKVVY